MGLLGWFTGATSDEQATQDDLNSLDDRTAIIKAVSTTPGTTPDQVLVDYGDFDSDHSPETHDRANGKAANRGPDGVGYCTKAEVDKYYDDGRPYKGLRIL
jgi:hypothetical protein